MPLSGQSVLALWKSGAAGSQPPSWSSAQARSIIPALKASLRCRLPSLEPLRPKPARTPCQQIYQVPWRRTFRDAVADVLTATELAFSAANVTNSILNEGVRFENMVDAFSTLSDIIDQVSGGNTTMNNTPSVGIGRPFTPPSLTLRTGVGGSGEGPAFSGGSFASPDRDVHDGFLFDNYIGGPTISLPVGGGDSGGGSVDPGNVLVGVPERIE